MFPFGSVENEELANLNNFDLPSFVDSAPSFEITSGLINLPNLDNSSYHTLQDLSTLDTSDNYLSLLHLNIRSLSLHVYELVSTLATLKINFDVIGVSETWNSFENPIKIMLKFLVTATFHVSHIVKMVVLRFT